MSTQTKKVRSKKVKAKKKSAAQVKKEKVLFELLSFFRQYREGAALCVAEKVKDEVPHFETSKSGRPRKPLYNLGVMYLEEAGLHTSIVQTQTKAGKVKTKEIETQLYVLGEEGDLWLSTYEAEQTEALRLDWLEKSQSAKGLTEAISGQRECIERYFTEWKQLVESANTLEQYEPNHWAEALSGSLHLTLQETQERLLQEVTTHIERAMTEVRQQLTRKIQQEMQGPAALLRDLSANLGRVQTEMEKLSQQNQLLTGIATEHIPTYFLGEEPVFTPPPVESVQHQEPELKQAKPLRSLEASAVELGTALQSQKSDALPPETSGATLADGTPVGWDDLCSLVLDAIPESAWMELPELHDILHEEWRLLLGPGLLKDVVVTLTEAEFIRLRPWVESIYLIPHPEYAILQPQNKVIYFVKKNQ